MVGGGGTGQVHGKAVYTQVVTKLMCPYAPM